MQCFTQHKWPPCSGSSGVSAGLMQPKLSEAPSCRLPSSQKGGRTANRCLTFNVIAAAPRLEVGPT